MLRDKKSFRKVTILPKYANLSKLTLPITLSIDGIMISDRRFELWRL